MANPDIRRSRFGELLELVRQLDLLFGAEVEGEPSGGAVEVVGDGLKGSDRSPLSPRASMFGKLTHRSDHGVSLIA